MAKLKRQSQECTGCGDHFTTYRNYDYCKDCAVNGHRYVSNRNCSECDGLGVIKFRGQKPRPCKLCALTKTMPKNNQKLTAEEQEEQYWEEVDQLAQQKIHQLLTTNLPFQNIKLITEPWKYEDRQQKLTGLFLRRDVDYRALLNDVENQYAEQNLPDQETVAEEITVWYCRMVMKSLISNLSNYSSYDPSLFSDLTTDDY